jgi:hypothetical protein
MKGRIITAITFCLLMVSCASDDDVPRDVIPVEQMKFIVYDVLRAQEVAMLTSAKDSTKTKIKAAELMQQVFAIYKISKDDFYKSFKFYQSHPDNIKILFDSVSNYANRKRQDLYMKLR